MSHRLAVVETEAIGARTRIGEFAIIREGAVLGDDVVIHPHAFVESGVTLEDGVEVMPYAYIGRRPSRSPALAREPGPSGPVRIGAGTSVGVQARVWTDVVIGPGCLIGESAGIREGSTIGSETVIGAFVAADAGTRVGDRTRVIGHSILAGEVGSDVFISVQVGVANDNTFGRRGYRPEAVGPPTIRDGAMIGVGATLLPRVVIGYRATVAARSLVTRDVADDTLVMGVPARVVTPGRGA